MVNDPRVTAVLARLGGVYRDPARVDRDASTLLKSSVGSSLVPISATRVENNGHSSTVLVLQGTIAMHFRGTDYQILVDIYLPSGYPIKPPVPYVRLARNMYLTENHRHVGADGQVYLPILHEWKASRDNLIELVVAMSSVFSAAPPVFTRETPAPPPPPQDLPPPPMPTNFASHHHHNNNNNDASDFQSESTREAILAAEAAEANAAAAVARAADEEERRRAEEEKRRAEEERRRIMEEERRQAEEESRRAEEERRRMEALNAQKQWEEAQTQRIRQEVVQKIRSYLSEQSRQVQAQVQNDWRDQQRLDHAAEVKIAKQIEMLKRKKEELTKHCATVEKSIEDVQEWIKEAEETKDNEQQLTADEMVEASSPLHAQMMNLSAENAAISDALYFLDRALYQGHLDCVTHQKQVRLLAKRQFLVRAHLIKINQVLLDRERGGRVGGF